jgi:hypothetical protein
MSAINRPVQEMQDQGIQILFAILGAAILTLYQSHSKSVASSSRNFHVTERDGKK